MLLQLQFAVPSPLKQSIASMFSWDVSLISSGWTSNFFGLHDCSPQLSFKSVSIVCSGGRERRKQPVTQRFGFLDV